MTWIIWGNAKHKADCKEKAARVAIAGEMFNLEKKMVEAAGVEPASENVTGQETTCLFAFMPSALPEDVRGPRSERTRNASR